MRIEMAEDKLLPGAWRIEIFDLDSEGECFIALFTGPSAKERAREYADWKRQRFSQ